MAVNKKYLYINIILKYSTYGNFGGLSPDHSKLFMNIHFYAYSNIMIIIQNTNYIKYI